MANKKQAVALQYDQKQSRGAPKVVAVGEGWVADKIIAAAREHGIPIHEDVEIVARLVRITPGSEIPPELYQAVAKVLAFLYKLENEQRGK